MATSFLRATNTLEKGLKYVLTKPNSPGRIREGYIYNSFLSKHTDIDGLLAEFRLQEGSKAQGYEIRESFAVGETMDSKMFHAFLKDYQDQYLLGRDCIAPAHFDSHVFHFQGFCTTLDSNGRVLNFKGKAKWKELRRQRTVIDSLCKKYGLSIIESPKIGKGLNIDQYKCRTKGADRSYIRYIKMTIKKIAKLSKNWDDFINRMKKHGIEVRLRGECGISFKWKDTVRGVDGKPIEKNRILRGKSLGDNFVKQAIEKQIFHDDPRPAQSTVARKDEKIQRAKKALKDMNVVSHSKKNSQDSSKSINNEHLNKGGVKL
ncbi:MAG TPA: hypothetical protein DD725_05620 [Deltaproteobacteria bacterium]|nr:hypothetical protein [Deltaproteobacteria bacterium]